MVRTFCRGLQGDQISAEDDDDENFDDENDGGVAANGSTHEGATVSCVITMRWFLLFCAKVLPCITPPLAFPEGGGFAFRMICPPMDPAVGHCHIRSLGSHHFALPSSPHPPARPARTAALLGEDWSPQVGTLRRAAGRGGESWLLGWLRRVDGRHVWRALTTAWASCGCRPRLQPHTCYALFCLQL